MNNTIPKDLPITDPLLFSFLMILDSVKFQVSLDGTDNLTQEDLPAFHYAVNSWSTINVDGVKMLRMEVLCALWKNKPEACETIWSHFPNFIERAAHKLNLIKIPYKYEFENWRIRTFDELNEIIGGLSAINKLRNADKSINELLSDIYNWQIENDEIKYVYAAEKNATQIMGVGAAFILLAPHNTCCPKLDKDKLSKSYFESLGFNFGEC